MEDGPEDRQVSSLKKPRKKKDVVDLLNEYARFRDEPKKCPGCQKRTLAQHKWFRTLMFCLSCFRIYRLIPHPDFQGEPEPRKPRKRVTAGGRAG